MTELLAGKKTHILVLAAVVLNALQTVSQGETLMTTEQALQTIQLALVSTFKMGVDRVLARVK